MSPLRFRNELVKTPSGKIKFRRYRDGGHERYHVWLWLDEDDRILDRVESVEYELHPTFKNRIRGSASRSNKFSITFWAWGEFDVAIRVHMRDGSIREATHSLHFELPADTGDNYADVGG